MDEAALISAAQQGDLNSFNRLVLAYQDQVYNHAYWMMGETEAAQDAVQEAFISAYRNIHSFRGGSFRAWILRIVSNVCYDEIRRRKRRPTTPLEPVDDLNEEMESPSWLADPFRVSRRSRSAPGIKSSHPKMPAGFTCRVPDGCGPGGYRWSRLC